MELYLQHYFRSHDFKKPYIASFSTTKNALIEKGHKKLCGPYLIAENRYN